MTPYPKVIVQTLENYAKSQLSFVQTIAELAAKSAYVECLYDSHVVEIVLPLVTNINPTVRMNAVLCLARLTNNSEACANQILCAKSLLNRLFGQVAKENKYYKKNCMNLVRNFSKHSPSNSEIIVKECGGLDAILTCMKDFDITVREAALQAISSIIRQDANIAQYIVNSGVLPLISLCLKENQPNLKLYALTTLNEMAKHNQDLAQIIVDVPVLQHVIQFLSPNYTDIKVQRAALLLVKSIVKHSLFLTENAIEANLFPDILLLTAHPDESIRHNAAKVIREVVKHSVQIAQMVVNTGGIASLVNVILCSHEFPPTPAIIALGFIAAMSPMLATAIIHSQALMHMTNILKSNIDTMTKAGTIWTLGMIGQHSSEHSRSICTGDAMIIMMDVYMDSSLNDESRTKCKAALQLILNGCDDYNILEKLLSPLAPFEMMAYILEHISKILPKNTKARRLFLTNGHLKMIQNLKTEIDSELFKIIKAINCCYPEDILQMIAGDFPEAVLLKVDRYVPKSQHLFYNRPMKAEKNQNKSVMSMRKPVSHESSVE